VNHFTSSFLRRYVGSFGVDDRYDGGSIIAVDVPDVAGEYKQGFIGYLNQQSFW
jgi:hypothetical protein